AKQLEEKQALLAQLTKARDEQARLATENSELLARLAEPRENQDQARQLQQANSKLEEVQLRNDLLLMQLHQVQDELTRYLQREQDLQAELRKAEQRAQRL